MSFQGALPGRMYITSSSVDRSLSQNRSHAGTGIGNGKRDGDELKLSPQGKMMNLINGLMKQREEVTQRKNDLIRSTLENGGKLDDIKTQLESYEEKLDTIEKQISQLTADMARIAAEKEEKGKEKRPGENKTEEELENERIHDIAALPADIKRAQAVLSTVDKAKREASLKQGEIRSSELFIEVLKTKKLGNSGIDVEGMIKNERAVIRQKRKLLNKINAFTDDLSANLASMMKENAQEVDGIEEKGIEQASRKEETASDNGSRAYLENAVPRTSEEGTPRIAKKSRLNAGGARP